MPVYTRTSICFLAKIISICSFSLKKKIRESPYFHIPDERFLINLVDNGKKCFLPQKDDHVAIKFTQTYIYIYTFLDCRFVVCPPWPIQWCMHMLSLTLIYLTASYGWPCMHESSLQVNTSHIDLASYRLYISSASLCSLPVVTMKQRLMFAPFIVK